MRHQPPHGPTLTIGHLARAGAGCSALCGDGIFALSIMIVGLIAGTPLVGVAAARQTVRERRAHRSALAAIAPSRGDVWADHMRRRAAPHALWLAARHGPPRLDW